MNDRSSTAGRQIRLFLVDGTPAGLMTAEVMNWTGKAIVAPRARFADLVRREEATRTGIYILIGPDPERTNGLKVYIGEADSVGKRLRRHDSGDEMDFFDRLRRLRTTPARKPPTECCCQSVAFIIAAIVAPWGDCSIAMTRDCLEPGLAFRPVVSLAASEGLVAVRGIVDADADFFEAVDI